MLFRQRLSDFLHKYLRIPYILHTHEFQSPRKPKATYVFIHGIGNTLHSWDEVVAGLPKDVRLIGIDLLGFGKSPRPAWVAYSAKTQARSVGATLLRLRLTQQPIIVGHSLGALVAVEIARRYSLIARQLVLCSPPFYAPESDKKGIKPPEDILRELYRVAKRFPEQLERLSPVAVRLGLANKTLNITKDNVVSYMAALEASIINQTSLKDVATLRVPVDIFYGVLDPVVIKKHSIDLAKKYEHITTHRLNAGHEIVGSYVRSLTEFLSALRH